MSKSLRIVFLGNFGVDYSSENHHKRSLEDLGHEVVALQEGTTGAEHIQHCALGADLFIWVHTHGWPTPTSHHGALNMVSVLQRLKRVGVPTVTYHLDLWLGLDRQKDLEQDEFYKHIGHFFTVDKLMADWFNANTEVKGHYLAAGAFGEECYRVEPSQQSTGNDVIFVGSRGYHPEWPYRPQLVDWLKDTYEDKFGHYSGEVEALGLRRGASLNQLYADSKIAIGDTLCINFDYPYYFSDRVFETTGRGGFIIHPYIRGLEDYFVNNKEIVFYKFGDFEQLKQLIDYYLTHDEEREAIRKAGFERTKKDHTYKNRWETIIKKVGL